MEIPVRYIHDNIVWTANTSQAWAIWRVDQPMSFRYLKTTEKLKTHDRIRATMHNLPADSMILSVCRMIDPQAVVSRMNRGADLTNEAWQEHARHAAGELWTSGAWDRYFFIVAALPGQTKFSWLGSAVSELGASIGMNPQIVGSKEITSRKRQAAHMFEELGSGLSLRPASTGEVRWLYQRSAYRGVADSDIDTKWNPETSPMDHPTPEHRGRKLTPLVDAIYTEGGAKDDTDRPRHRRYMSIETELGTSYQTYMAVSGLPNRWEFPDGGGEWWAAADTAPWPVDWFVRIKSIPNQVAQTKSRRQHRQLSGQVDEYDGDSSGVPASLQESLDSIDEERRVLAGSPSTPQLEATLVFSLASNSLADLEDQAESLRSQYGSYEYDMQRPTGGQLALHKASLPGSVMPPVCRAYTQYFMPSDLAAGMPFLSARVGDPIGMYLGTSLDGGSKLPVLFDPAYGPATNRSGSLGGIGHLGSGKSYFIKQVLLGLLARGGRAVVLDRTASGEYVKFSKVTPGTRQIVEFHPDADVRIDPMRMFDDEGDRVRYTLNFLTLLTGVQPTSVAGTVLAEACRDAAAKPNGTIHDVIEFLRTVTDRGDKAKELSYQLSSFTADKLSQIVFGEGEVLDLHADLIVMHTPGLQLPDREHLLNSHLAAKLLPEQIFSQAVLYLITAIARTVTFTDKRFAAAVFDEAWSLVASPQGEALMLEGIRDGRKHNAAMYLLSQHPEDLPAKLASLLGNRFVFRQAAGAGAHALRLLGTDPSPHLVDLVENRLTEGQGLFRDVAGRIGLIQVAAAGDPTVAAAIDTTPDSAAIPISDDYQLAKV